jgi:hypothetical protein
VNIVFNIYVHTAKQKSKILRKWAPTYIGLVGTSRSRLPMEVDCKLFFNVCENLHEIGYLWVHEWRFRN